MDVSGEKYVLFTTFKRDGTAVASPVWCTPLADGTFGFWTSSDSGKAKRLRNGDRVIVQPCDRRGRPRDGTSSTEGTARLVTGTELDDIRSRIVAKYGVMAKMSTFLTGAVNALKRVHRPYADVGVVVTTSS